MGAEQFKDGGEGGDAEFGADGWAIVEQDDRAGAEAASDASGDLGGIVGEGIAAANGPADVGEFAVGESGGEEEVFYPDGGAETEGARHTGGGEGGEGGIEFVVHAGGGRAPEIGERMGVGVVGDFVAAAGDFGDERGVLRGALADEEKGNSGVVLIEQVESARGVGGVGSIVEREPDLAGIGGGWSEV